MADVQYITKINTDKGPLKIDYNSLANLPQLDKFADAKETEAAISAVSKNVTEISEDVANIADNLTPQAIGAAATINGIKPGDNGNVQLTASDVGAATVDHTHNKLTGLDAGRVLVTNSAGESVTSSITVEKLNTLESIESNIQTQINELKGADSNIQTQLAGKANSEHTHGYLPISGGTLTGTTVASSTAVGTRGIRNINAGTDSLASGYSALATGEIYIQYE